MGEKFFKSLPSHNGYLLPMVFFLLASSLAWLVCLPLEYLRTGRLDPPGILGQLAIFLFIFVFAVIVQPLICAFIHLLLRLFRAGGGGLEATFRVFCYVSVLVIIFAPLSTLFPLGKANVWNSVGFVVAAYGLAVVHKTTFRRVIAAMALGLVVGVILVLVAVPLLVAVKNAGAASFL